MRGISRYSCKPAQLKSNGCGKDCLGFGCCLVRVAGIRAGGGKINMCIVQSSLLGVKLRIRNLKTTTKARAVCFGVKENDVQ